MYLHICTNERHNCCKLSMQQSEMLLYALNLGFFILGFAIYTVAYGSQKAKHIPCTGGEQLTS